MEDVIEKPVLCLERFSLGSRKIFGFALLRNMIGLKKPASLFHPIRGNTVRERNRDSCLGIVTRSYTFSRASRDVSYMYLLELKF